MVAGRKKLAEVKVKAGGYGVARSPSAVALIYMAGMRRRASAHRAWRQQSRGARARM